MNLKVLEPVRYLFKDEVRAVGEELGLSHEICWRHPFPGPGLAIRCLGEVTKERLDMLREADAIVLEEIKQIAKKSRIPVIENKPLARGLHKVVKVGQYVPDEFYKVVAEVLAYVYRLRKA